MLDAVIDYLPSPLDVPPVTGIDPRTSEEVTRHDGSGRAVRRPGLQDRRRPVRRQAGLLPGLLRHAEDRLLRLQLDQGRARSGSGAWSQLHANHREEIESVSAGDIAAAVGLKNTFTGDTLSDEAKPIVLENITFPEPVIELAVEPKTKADQDKMSIALQRLAEEDPTFRVSTDEETRQTRIAGMGELHLEVIVDRMLREFKVQANVGRPQVSYREAIRKAGQGRGSLRAPDRRQGPVRPRRHHPRAARARGRRRIRVEDRRRRGAARVLQADRAGHPRRAGRRRGGRLPGHRPQGRPSSTARSTRSTRPRWRSRSPARMAAKDGVAKADPGDPGAGHEGRGRRPRRTSWATSSAT